MHTKKILICEEEEGIRESLKLILSDHYDLILANDGFQCLEILANAKDIAVVLLDIKMPQKNGLDILKEIQQKYPPVKVVMIIGYKAVETATEAIRLGASGYIVKPFKSDEILEMVEGQMG